MKLFWLSRVLFKKETKTKNKKNKNKKKKKAKLNKTSSLPWHCAPGYQMSQHCYLPLQHDLSYLATLAWEWQICRYKLRLAGWLAGCFTWLSMEASPMQSSSVKTYLSHAGWFNSQINAGLSATKCCNMLSI